MWIPLNSGGWAGVYLRGQSMGGGGKPTVVRGLNVHL